MNQIRTLCCAVLALGFVQAAAPAAVIVYSATLNGANESPPNASPATGSATVTVDTTVHTMRVQTSFTGLQSGTTASHIHAATAVAGTGTAGVATTTPTFAGFPLGVTSGTYDSTLDMTLASNYNSAYVTANGGTTASAESALLASFAAGTAYFNIHTTNAPGGEIRGFLAVPEPASLSAIAITGVLTLRRRPAV